MSYAILTIYYGVPISTKNGRSSALHKFVDLAPDGLHTTYNGSSSPPAAFGVSLGGFNECCHHVNIDQLSLVPTSEQKKQFNALFDALSQRNQELLNELGGPRVFFLVGAS